MANSYSRGQSAIELLIIMLALTSLVLAFFEFSEVGARLFSTSQLSREKK